MRRRIDTAAADLRSLVHAVMPSALLEPGLGLAADYLVDRLPVPAELSVGDIERLPRSVASSAYFVVAEALTNVVKHAAASKVSVRLNTIDGILGPSSHLPQRPTDPIFGLVPKVGWSRSSGVKCCRASGSQVRR